MYDDLTGAKVLKGERILFNAFCRSGTATALALRGTSRILAYLMYYFNYVCTAESTVLAHEAIMLDDG
jgi:hypothetical protein